MGKLSLTGAKRTIAEGICQAAWGLAKEPLTSLAYDKGYALATHGSMARDIDLIAVAWTEKASPAQELINGFVRVLEGLFGDAYELGDPCQKPHGRIAFKIMAFARTDIDFDVSVIPPSQPNGDTDG